MSELIDQQLRVTGFAQVVAVLKPPAQHPIEGVLASTRPPGEAPPETLRRSRPASRALPVTIRSRICALVLRSTDAGPAFSPRGPCECRRFE